MPRSMINWKRYRTAGGIAAAVMLLDQLSKWYILDVLRLPERPPIEVTPFFNLVMVWNHGISFGLLAGGGTFRVVLLLAVAAVIVIVLLHWLRQTEDPLLVTAIGLVIGGAIGNMIDRLRYGAVADFLDVHVGVWHWPSFNVADSAICIGVALICWVSLRREPAPSISNHKEQP